LALFLANSGNQLATTPQYEQTFSPIVLPRERMEWSMPVEHSRQLAEKNCSTDGKQRSPLSADNPYVDPKHIRLTSQSQDRFGETVEQILGLYGEAARRLADVIAELSAAAAGSDQVVFELANSRVDEARFLIGQVQSGLDARRSR